VRVNDGFEEYNVCGGAKLSIVIENTVEIKILSGINCLMGLIEVENRLRIVFSISL